MPGAPRHHYLRRDGRRIHCLEWPADGPAIVCLHHMWATADIWADLPAALGGRFRVLALDTAGHGETDLADPDDPLVDLGAVIDEVVGGPAILVGASAGGMRAGIFALERPTAARRLILVEPPILADDTARDNERARMAGLPAAPATLDALYAGYRRIFPHARPDLLRAYLQRTHRFVEGAWRPHVAITEPVTFTSRHRFAEPDLARLTLPVLLFYAENSRLCGPEGGRRLGAAIPNCEVVAVPDAGHLVLLTQPELVYDRIARFCAPELAPAAPT
jgi:pimeloyl-ACP methyl ester carboxylesterase